MTKLLSGKTALVTGGGVGIGRAIAVGLAEAGAHVAVTHLKHAPDLELCERVRSASGAELTSIALDVTSEAGIIEAIATAHEVLGPLDILVNNIGGLIRRSSIAEMDFNLWRQVMAINLDSTFLVTHHALANMNPAGRIINIASLAGRNGGHAGATAYATAKAGIFGFTRGLSKELAPAGITVNAVAPGFIEATPFHDIFTTEESKAATIAGIPLRRPGEPEDVAGPVVWLASDFARFVTGTIIDINGGQYFG